MTTYRELVYMILDLLKERSDDAYYTEEHIIFLVNKARAFLLDKKYKTSRNQSFQKVSSENKQTIYLTLDSAKELAYSCNGVWLKSKERVSELMFEDTISVHTVNDMLFSNVTYVPRERIPFVGFNKWLRNIIYCSRSSDGYMYFHSANPQFIFLESIIMSGIFVNPSDMYKYECTEDGSNISCDILDSRFPLESELVPAVIETVLQELSPSRFIPEDKRNNAKDDSDTVPTAQEKDKVNETEDNK